MKKKSSFIAQSVVVIVALCVLALLLFLRLSDPGKVNSEDTVLSTERDALETVSPEPEQTSAPEAVVTPDPKPSAEPIPEPEDTPEPSPTETPSPEPELTLHSGLREDGSFDEGTLFIGDSLTFLMITHYLDTYELIGDAKYTCKAGAGLSVYFGGYRLMYGEEYNCLFPPEWYGMTFPEAAADFGDAATAIYIMLGTNQDPNASPKSYIDIVDHLLEVCPNATIHLQTVPYSTAIPYEKVNENIRGAHEYYLEAGEYRVLLLDTCTAIGDNLIFDGVHMNDTGRDNWYKAILAHAEENGLSQ